MVFSLLCVKVSLKPRCVLCLQDCSKCHASGTVECEQCDGSGYDVRICSTNPHGQTGVDVATLVNTAACLEWHFPSMRVCRKSVGSVTAPEPVTTKAAPTVMAKEERGTVGLTSALWNTSQLNKLSRPIHATFEGGCSTD